jgi:hypothetical protein
MIRHLIMGDISAPHFICDHCGDPIATSGNVLWRLGPDYQPTGEWWTVHKPCGRLFEARFAPEALSWEELATFLRQLAHNYQHPASRAWVKLPSPSSPRRTTPKGAP